MHAEGQYQTLYACSSFLDDVPFSSLVSYLASGIGTSTTATRRTSTTTPSNTSTASSSSAVSDSRPQFPVEAILGIVFGVLSLLGLLAGLFVWRVHKRRTSVAHEEY